MESVKLYAINSLTLVMTFTNIENTLKIMLLLMSIVYTAVKIYQSINKKDEDSN
jgi:hypothetical protein